MTAFDESVEHSVRAAEGRGEDPLAFEARLWKRLDHPVMARLFRAARRHRDWPVLALPGRLRP